MPTPVKYWLLQLPSTACFAAVLWWARSAEWIAPPWPWVLLLAWVVKDAVLYPITRDAYRATEGRHGPQPGQLGKVRRPLSPDGTVMVSGTLWQARLHRPDRVVEAGELVRIVEGKGLVLIVERDSADSAGNRT